MFFLRGVYLYMRPQKHSGGYRLKLSFDAELYSQFGLVYYDPSTVEIIQDPDGDYFPTVYAKNIVVFEQNTEFDKYFDFKGNLVVKKLLDFDVALVPVDGR